VPVIFFTTANIGVLTATITSAGCAMSSLAKIGMRSARPAAQRTLRATSRPSLQPSASSRSRSAVKRSLPSGSPLCVVHQHADLVQSLARLGERSARSDARSWPRLRADQLRADRLR
jgi:hypothetical protein